MYIPHQLAQTLQQERVADGLRRSQGRRMRNERTVQTDTGGRPRSRELSLWARINALLSAAARP